MALKTLDELYVAVDTAVHGDGPQGKTTAAGLNALLKLLATQLVDAQVLTDEPLTYLFQVVNADENSAYTLGITATQARMLVDQPGQTIVLTGADPDGNPHSVTLGYDLTRAEFVTSTFDADGNSVPVRLVGTGTDTLSTDDLTDATPAGREWLKAADATAWKTLLGLSRVDDTSDAEKPLSIVTQALANTFSADLATKTSINDSVTATGTTWSSTKIASSLAVGQLTVFNFKTGDTVKRIPFFAKVVLDTFKSCTGGNTYTFSLTLCTGTVISNAVSTIGAINTAIAGLTAAQASAGYEVAVNYTGTAAYATAQLKTFPL